MFNHDIMKHHMPTLKNYVARYKMDKKLLEKHPEQRELLEKKNCKA